MDLKKGKIKKEECYLCGKLCGSKGLKSHIRSHTSIKIYECDECSHRFSSRKLLQQHKIIHSTHYVCEDCNGKYKDTDHLKKHKCIPEREQKICHLCGKSCAPRGFNSHIRSHKNRKTYVCEQCGHHYSSKRKLKMHEVTHKTVYHCEDCNKRYRDAKMFKNHKCIYGKEKRNFCEFCGKGFFTKYDLTRHNRTHTNEKPYLCNVCGKKFTQKCNLDTHFRTHSKLVKCESDGESREVKEKKFVCEICFQSFGYKSHLKRHNLIHTEERPYSCKICYKGFTQNSYLKVHMLLHTGERPYKCDKCEKSYPCKSKLVHHKKRHKDPKLFCSVCNKGFFSPSDLDRHLVTHTRAKPYICDVCHKGFTARYTLKLHYFSHVSRNEQKNSDSDVSQEYHLDDLYSISNFASDENKPYTCTNCEKNFLDDISLKNHYDKFMVEGNFKCCVCEKSFGEKENLLQHQITHQDSIMHVNASSSSNDFSKIENKKYPCTVCSSTFTTNIDLQHHINEFLLDNFFKCCLCQQVFTAKENLLEHHKLHHNFKTLEGTFLQNDISSCKVCKEVFSNEIMLNLHYNEFLQEENYKCCLCKQVYKTKENLMEHQMIHDTPSVKKPFVCFLKSEL